METRLWPLGAGLLFTCVFFPWFNEAKSQGDRIVLTLSAKGEGHQFASLCACVHSGNDNTVYCQTSPLKTLQAHHSRDSGTMMQAGLVWRLQEMSLWASCTSSSEDPSSRTRPGEHIGTFQAACRLFHRERGGSGPMAKYEAVTLVAGLWKFYILYVKW